MIDFDGNVVVRGRMTHPADDAGHFPDPPSDFLRIGRGSSVVRCRVTRHPSGFVETEDFGGALYLPPSLYHALARALSFRPRQALDVAQAHQEGVLASSTSMISHMSQPLTDWRLRAFEQGMALTVQISAALHGEHFESWSKTTANFWTGRDTPPRIDVEYTVDPMTRMLCFGTYFEEMQHKGEAEVWPAPPRTRLSSLCLRDALVGPHDIFGHEGEHWIHFYESHSAPFSGISITRHLRPARSPAGHIAGSGSYHWPRLHIAGLTMDNVASVIGQSRRAAITVEGDGLVYLEWLYGSEGSERRDARKAVIEFSLTDAGLEWDYTLVFDGGEQRGGFTLPWETLILRYPVFARFRKTIARQAEA